MAGFWQRRRVRKTGNDWLRHARTSRRMREDIAPAIGVMRLRVVEAELGASLKAGDIPRIEKACETIEPLVHAVTPPQRHGAVRENLEVIVVAVAVAMAFRTYFLQPFKIPTGSMQPTLYGIHYAPHEAPPTALDRFPLNLVKLALFGERYHELTARNSGELRGPLLYPNGSPQDQNGLLRYLIGNVEHRMPKEATLHCHVGTMVVAGQRVASWDRTIGDHLFVNRVRWNVLPPGRGEVMVFRTDGIDGLEPKTHYIKRLVGLPGETISIDEPYLLIGGKRVDGPETIRRIQNRDAGYAGYIMAGGGAEFLSVPGQSVHLTGSQYFAMGDNTRNSKDSRYWGPVPAANMVAPACIVYWPLSRRWGLID